MRLPLNEEVENALKQIPAILSEISKSVQRNNADGGSFMAQFTTRLADVESRIQKIESLLITKTVAGKPKLTDDGKRVGVQWYKREIEK